MHDENGLWIMALQQESSGCKTVHMTWAYFLKSIIRTWSYPKQEEYPEYNKQYT